MEISEVCASMMVLARATASLFWPLVASSWAMSMAPRWCSIICWRNSRAVGPGGLLERLHVVFAHHAAPVIHAAHVGGAGTPVLQPAFHLRDLGFLRGLICSARAVTRSSMPSFDRRVSDISIACVWCSIIMLANMTSASLASADCAGVALLLLPWSIPGILPPEVVPTAQPARMSAVARVSAAVAAVRVFMVMFSPSR